MHVARASVFSDLIDNAATGEARRTPRPERVYREGLEWCERERCPIDAALCLMGLADVAERRGNGGNEHISRARQIFERHGARLYLDRLAVRQSN